MDAGSLKVDLKTGWSSSTALSTSAKKLPWVSAQPLGRPVVPEVYMTVARESGPRTPRRTATSWSGTSRPSSASRSVCPFSKIHMCWTSGSRSRSGPSAAACDTCSTAIATAPESWRIQRVWKMDEVG